MAKSSMASLLKAYWLPLILLASSVFYHLFILPLLGIKRDSSIEEVAEAYEKLSSKWNAGVEVPPTIDFVKIRYAFELLTNPLWKRNYDLFSIDEHIHVIENAKAQHAGASLSEIELPLLEATSFDPGDAPNIITSGNFFSKLDNAKALLIQVFSVGSNRCAQFASNWERIAALLDGVANTGLVELGEVRLAKYLAEKTFTGQPSFPNGLPSLVAFPPRCNSSTCLLRYEGELSVDAVTDWVATTILGLPRIPYYSKDSLEQGFLRKTSPHKVRVILFSETGVRATPFVRQAALNYWPYAAFAFVLWREEESSFWWNVYVDLLLFGKFGVESAPAIVFLREPGVKPVVYHGMSLFLFLFVPLNTHSQYLVAELICCVTSLVVLLFAGPGNNSWFVNLMEQNKHHVLPQLRSLTSMELGCDARGYSRAGNETSIWYCVILAGRQSPELHKMRETVRRIQEILSTDGVLHSVDQDQPPAPPAVALKEKRLTFTWLDGEAQQKYCFFIIQTASSYETCGPRRDITDLPQLLIVRYKRNASEDSIKIDRKPKNILEAFHDDDVDPASQLVARYNGSEEIPEIIKWISQIIEDGDSKDLPFFRTKAPALVPEDADPIWSVGARSILSKGTGMKQKIGGIVNGIHSCLGDPRIGPVLLLGALMSFGNIWLRRSQSTPPSQSNQEAQPSRTDLNGTSANIGVSAWTETDQSGDATQELRQTKIFPLPSLTWNQKMRTRCHYQIQTRRVDAWMVFYLTSMGNALGFLERKDQNML
ncbi:hypothetical protein RHSIM_Rhsim08G0152800 [Rhododendron simsii]|uniref:J domain-containing protein n=1 Tax=Rhododendron simsii TaxID=118357 RepID=A0A834LIW6_RHOSS|nr:hypothetical protein RHSIM_Rhsim08G0152800 [Rhododendron simsii]